MVAQVHGRGAEGGRSKVPVSGAKEAALLKGSGTRPEGRER